MYANMLKFIINYRFELISQRRYFCSWTFFSIMVQICKLWTSWLDISKKKHVPSIQFVKTYDTHWMEELNLWVSGQVMKEAVVVILFVQSDTNSHDKFILFSFNYLQMFFLFFSAVYHKLLMSLSCPLIKSSINTPFKDFLFVIIWWIKVDYIAARTVRGSVRN